MQVVENFCSFILPIFFLSVHGTFFFCLGIFYEKKKQSGEYKKMTLLEEQKRKKEAGYRKSKKMKVKPSLRAASSARETVEVRLSITGAPVADISVSGEVNFADLWEDPARNIPAVAKHLGELLLVAFSLANPDMTENDTD